MDRKWSFIYCYDGFALFAIVLIPLFFWKLSFSDQFSVYFVIFTTLYSWLGPFLEQNRTRSRLYRFSYNLRGITLIWMSVLFLTAVIHRFL